MNGMQTLPQLTPGRTRASMRDSGVEALTLTLKMFLETFLRINPKNFGGTFKDFLPLNIYWSSFLRNLRKISKGTINFLPLNIYWSSFLRFLKKISKGTILEKTLLSTRAVYDSGNMSQEVLRLVSKYDNHICTKNAKIIITKFLGNQKELTTY